MCIAKVTRMYFILGTHPSTDPDLRDPLAGKEVFPIYSQLVGFQVLIPGSSNFVRPLSTEL